MNDFDIEDLNAPLGDQYTLESQHGGQEGISYNQCFERDIPFEMRVWSMRPGSEEGEHQHYSQYEMYCVLEGEIVFLSKGKEIILQTGKVLCVRPEVMHAVSNRSDKDARLLVLTCNERIEIPFM